MTLRVEVLGNPCHHRCLHRWTAEVKALGLFKSEVLKQVQHDAMGVEYRIPKQFEYKEIALEFHQLLRLLMEQCVI